MQDYYCLKDVDIKFQHVIPKINNHNVSEEFINSWYQKTINFKNSMDFNNHQLYNIEPNKSHLIYISFGSYLTSCSTIAYIVNKLANEIRSTNSFLISSSNDKNVQSCINNSIMDTYQNKIEDGSIDIRLVVDRQSAKKADIIISACGANTLVESIADMTPIICFPLGEEQYWNAGMVEKFGFGGYIYDKHKDPLVRSYDITFDENGQNKDFDSVLYAAVRSIKINYNSIIGNYINFVQENENFSHEISVLQGSVKEFLDDFGI
jgi:hypothetical protein